MCPDAPYFIILLCLTPGDVTGLGRMSGLNGLNSPLKTGNIMSYAKSKINNFIKSIEYLNSWHDGRCNTHLVGYQLIYIQAHGIHNC